jgi:hypothetical protein
VVTLGFEVLYIALRAFQGQQSHFNVSTPFSAALFSVIALAATAATIATAYIGLLFRTNNFPELPAAYIWAIRFGIFLFVIFAFQGFTMGSRLSHTVGAINDNSDLFVLGWSKRVGDLRVAHFLGMHALQILPLAAFYLLRNVKCIALVAAVYAIMAAYSWVQALKGTPFQKVFSSKTVDNK